jgi:hypothetical protein
MISFLNHFRFRFYPITPSGPGRDERNDQRFALQNLYRKKSALQTMLKSGEVQHEPRFPDRDLKVEREQEQI